MLPSMAYMQMSLSEWFKYMLGDLNAINLTILCNYTTDFQGTPGLLMTDLKEDIKPFKTGVLKMLLLYPFVCLWQEHKLRWTYKDA